MHPYERAPRTSFWKSSVSAGFDPVSLIADPEPLIRLSDTVASAGSCFAANLVPYLERRGYKYLREESRHPSFATLPKENLGYDDFSAAYGNVYTARQLLHLLRRSTGAFTPVEDRWHTADGVIDPFRPGLRYHALTDREFDLLSRQHLRAVRRVFETADVFIFTLGLTEAWVSSADGAVFPACPGTVSGSFNPARHAFVNFTAWEVAADLNAFIAELRAINAGVRVILTVSPVPLAATATSSHVVCASSYSKAALRVAAEDVSTRHARVDYFPAYEIVTGPQAAGAFFEADRRTVTKEGIDTVMHAFLSHCEQLPFARPVLVEPPRPSIHQQLSSALAEAECEEAMARPAATPLEKSA